MQLHTLLSVLAVPWENSIIFLMWKMLSKKERKIIYKWDTDNDTFLLYLPNADEFPRTVSWRNLMFATAKES